uniref:Transposase n=1 Tax=Ascaris lumbricoides TaxID=6252 RepID=A0A0M3HKL4_ASCLU
MAHCVSGITIHFAAAREHTYTKLKTFDYVQKMPPDVIYIKQVPVLVSSIQVARLVSTQPLNVANEFCFVGGLAGLACVTHDREQNQDPTFPRPISLPPPG